ncbi:MAG: hypothetical protein K2Q14_07710, partial [Gammaproteobacteria bacterium]|nr:hypothetical protein [Gammaproteobacteria bacterium]
WERCELRGSCTVLREADGEVPPAYSPLTLQNSAPYYALSFNHIYLWDYRIRCCFYIEHIKRFNTGYTILKIPMDSSDMGDIFSHRIH